MAFDKVVDSATLDAGLTEIADAIRTKGGTDDKLTYPDGFVTAIGAISGEEESMPTGDTSVDWSTLEAVYVVFDTTTVPEGALARTFPITFRNSGKGTFEFGIVENGAFVSKEKYTNWEYDYAGYWIKGLKVPNLGKRYTVARITSDATNHITEIRLDRTPWTTVPDGFLRAVYGRGTYIQSLNCCFNQGCLPSCYYWDLEVGLTSGYNGMRLAGVKSLAAKCCKSTGKPTSCYQMFSGCSSLTTLDLSNFDTGAVTSMQNMFNDCSSLTTLDLNNFDTGAVTNMSYMFDCCSSLTTLDLSNFDTGAVTSMQSMFNGCTSLTDFTSPTFRISVDFSKCSKLTHNSLMSIINNLATATSTQKLTLGSTNKAKLTDDEITIATGKGWTVT